MYEFKAITYEHARREYLEEQMQKAQRRMKYWESRIDRSRPYNLMDAAHGKASDAGWEYSYYKDALEALEDNRFQYETGFVKGFESAQPKWISVEERLPVESETVLVYRDGCCGVARLLDVEPAIMWTYTGFGGDPTHWMPLPNPPKEET